MTVLDDFTDVAAWSLVTAAPSAIAADTSDADHPHAAKLTSRSGATVTVERDLAFSARYRYLTFWWKCLDANLSTFQMKLVVGGRNSNTLRFDATVANASSVVGTRWRRAAVPMAMFVSGGSSQAADDLLADVRMIQMTVTPVAGQVAEVLVSDLRVENLTAPPGVVFQFDDARLDTYTTAFPVLNARGMVGSIPVPTSLLGTSGPPQKMTLAQLQELCNTYGWEAVSHSKTHPQLDTLTAAQVDTELDDAYNFLLANGLSPLGARHVVYPGGLWNTTVYDETMRRFRSGRSVIDLRYVVPGVADGLMPVTYVVNTLTVATLKGVLDRLAARGGASILAFHSIADTNAGNDTYTWLTADFTEIADYVVSKGLRAYRMSDLWPDI